MFTTNQIVGTWKLIDCKSSSEGKIWTVNCINCGVIRKFNSGHLSKSGNCLACRNMPKGQSGFNRLYLKYKISAKDRKLDFSLMEEEFRLLTSSSCKYCGIKPSLMISGKAKTTSWGVYKYNGIDRVDNGRGYVSDNCVSCCTTCNFTKCRISESIFLEWIERIKMLGASEAR